MNIVSQTHISSDSNIVAQPFVSSSEDPLFRNDRTLAHYGPDSVYFDLIQDAQLPLEEFDEFQQYLDLFFTFNKKTPCHIKRSYLEGWRTLPPGRRKDGSRYDRPCWANLIARHLDNDRWNRSHPDKWDDDDRPFWVALRPGKCSKHRCIDIDNKAGVVGYYDYDCIFGRHGKEFKEDPLRPFSIVTLDHMKLVKRVYDAFPDQTWCISSLTLGLHAWEMYSRLVPLFRIERATRPTLRRIGLPGIEVHPMAHQVLRRPFGVHYHTIIDSCHISDWMDQLRLFQNPEFVSFDAICNAMCRLMRDQIREFNRGGIFQRWGRSPFVTESGLLRTSTVMDQILEIESWRQSGFPEATSSSVVVQGSDFLPPGGSSTSPFQSPSTNHCPGIDLNEVCNKQWVQSCVKWAKEGLPCDDSLNPVVMQLSRWFYFIELFHLPQEERMDRVIELMSLFIQKKHNGYVSRLNCGESSEVEGHIRRTVRSAVKTATEKDLFTVIRQKRQNGTYKYVLYLEQVVLGKSEEDNTLRSALYVGTICDPDPTPIPEVINMIERYYRKASIRLFRTTKDKLMAFVNFLGSQNGQSNLGQNKQLPKLGFKSGKQREHLKHLEQAGIIFIGDAYSTGRFGKMYRLSAKVKKLYDKQNVIESQKMVG